MKIAFVTDTHFGCREGRVIFHDFFEKFYRNVFFPRLKEEGITEVLHLGDCFDRRKYIDYYSLKRCKEYFFDAAKEAGVRIHMLVGNHDIALRNSLSINSPELLLQDYDNIIPISKPTDITLVDGTKFLMLPWVCADNYHESMSMLENSRADLLCGHLEISGFSMYRGMESHDGFEANLFSRFDMVFSGHYHHRSSRGRINYLGNPYELTHMDSGDPRGFHIFETSTRELTFIENPYTMFERIVYDDTNTDYRGIDVSLFSEKFVKVVVQKKNDYYAFDNFMDRLYNCGAHDIKVMESVSEMTSDEMDESLDIEDTQSILQHYIESSQVDVDRTELAKYMKQLYVEAVNISL